MGMMGTKAKAKTNAEDAEVRGGEQRQMQIPYWNDKSWVR
jgi:hypothetical protein